MVKKMTEKLRGLNRAIKSAEKRIAKEKRREEGETKTFEKAVRKFWQGREKRPSNKLELAKEIFRWGKEFSRSEEYRRLINLDRHLSEALTFWGNNSLWIYGEPWGGGEDEESSKRRFNLYLDEDGTITYCFPSHGIGGSGTGVSGLETPRELADELSMEHLKRLFAFIATGRGYEELRKNLKEALK